MSAREGARTLTPFLDSAFNEAQGKFSPDGRWVAYISVVTGRQEVYLRRFPAGADAIRVSTEGGVLPAWRGDGRELFYVALDGAMTAVDVNLSLGSVGQPRPLFPSMVRQSCCNQYAVARDGQRFLMVRALSGEPPIAVVLNWKARLHR